MQSLAFQIQSNKSARLLLKMQDNEVRPSRASEIPSESFAKHKSHVWLRNVAKPERQDKTIFIRDQDTSTRKLNSSLLVSPISSPFLSRESQVVIKRQR